MPIVNVNVEPKPPRLDNENKEVYAKSSDVTVWSLYDQSWETLVDEGLDRLFESRNQFEVERLKCHVE
ncbi:hypothetical protein [Rossellomorea sp. LjRoot5]|uniref:hypothetical protein n=1 Tax=Rossellomorea sp. LjRoot5 TaxID=3342331 RepID=UPI003ECD9F5E